ncbi:MAG TPA: nickel-binding protein [Cyclobacteriaceae bacterium]|jgi:AraC-like DNA-binding protein|nr:nickel-binding protein [Cyclobacteriaceae bacterium]
MPLFIDLHIDNSLTLDIIKQAHLADKALQAKHGVRYLQIMLNQPQGYLFCLMEGPDKESCARVHQEAHGHIACNILEITESDFSALVSNKQMDSLDFTLNGDGSLDTGIRTLLYISLLGSPENCRTTKEIINKLLKQSDGRSGESFENQLMVLFDSTTIAVDTAMSIRQSITESNVSVELRMAANLGPPLKEKGNFFEDVRKSVEHFAFLSENGQITISSKAMQLYTGDRKNNINALKVVQAADEKFLDELMGSLEKVWNKNDLTMDDFAREIGVSKSQLARKLKTLVEFTPNDFIKEYKLRKAVSLMDDQRLNMAEISMEVGFSNPSYFTKCFRKRFGKAPSEYGTMAS